MRSWPYWSMFDDGDEYEAAEIAAQVHQEGPPHPLVVSVGGAVHAYEVRDQARTAQREVPKVTCPEVSGLPVLARGEVEVKDPKILCPQCHEPGGRVRGQSGYRCGAPMCSKFGVVIATDNQVGCLKGFLRMQEDLDLFDWARAQQR